MSDFDCLDVADDATGLVSSGVESGIGNENFDISRKLLALAFLLVKDTLTPEAAAKEADGQMFEASVAADVDNGAISPEDGTDAVADRLAAVVVEIISEGLEELVVGGCAVAGGVLMGLFDGDVELGLEMGESIGRLLTPMVKTAVRAGTRKLVEYGRSAWNWIKETARDSLFQDESPVAMGVGL